MVEQQFFSTDSYATTIMTYLNKNKKHDNNTNMYLQHFGKKRTTTFKEKHTNLKQIQYT